MTLLLIEGVVLGGGAVIRNFLVVFFLIILYSFSLFFSELIFWFYAIISPIIVSTLGYSALLLSPIVKRFILSFVPLVSLPVTVFFPNLENNQIIIFLHFFVIGFALTQLYEATLWIFELVFSIFIKIKNHVLRTWF